MNQEERINTVKLMANIVMVFGAVAAGLLIFTNMPLWAVALLSAWIVYIMIYGLIYIGRWKNGT